MMENREADFKGHKSYRVATLAVAGLLVLDSLWELQMSISEHWPRSHLLVLWFCFVEVPLPWSARVNGVGQSVTPLDSTLPSAAKLDGNFFLLGLVTGEKC